MIYFFYLVVLVFLLILERNDKSHRKLYRIIIPLLYVFLIGLRGNNVGVDSNTYYDHYYTYGKWGCDFIEPGFDWLNRVLYAQGYEANSLFVAMAAISLLFLYLALDRLDRNYSISAFCVYLLTFTFFVNGMRQGVVCAIFFYAYKFIEEEKFIRYVSLLLFASLFHASSFLLIPLYFLKNHALPSFWYVVIYILSFGGLFLDLSAYMPQIDLGMRDYSSYVEEVNTEHASYLGFGVVSLLELLVFTLMLRNKIFKSMPLLANLVFLGFIFRNLGFNLPIVGRITIFFSWFVYLMYPIILAPDKIPMFRSRQFTCILLLVINGALWCNGILSPANKLLPYKFYWEDIR